MKRIIALLLLTVGVARAEFFDTGWDWEARNWQTNIVNKSGTLSSNSYLNGTIFTQQSKRWGIRPLLGRVGLYLGGNTNALLVPIIRDFFDTINGMDDLIGFAAADYSEATGLTGGSGKYLRPNGESGHPMSVAAVAHTNIHLAVYCRTSNVNNEYEMGEITASVGEYACIFTFGGSVYSRMGLNMSLSTANTNALGFLLTTRTATNACTQYRNTTALLTDSGNTGGSTSANAYIIVSGVNSAGTPTAFSTKIGCYYAIGQGIPATLVPAYQILVNGVQKRANRSVVP